MTPSGAKQKGLHCETKPLYGLCPAGRPDGGVVTQRIANPETADPNPYQFARLSLRSTHGVPPGSGYACELPGVPA